MEESITVAHIMDCPTIRVHAAKCYKANIDSGANILLLWYSTYKNIGDSYKTPIQPTTAKLNTADDSPMTALGKTALHLRIAKFKFTHNFVICNRLLDTEIIFGIDIQKKFSLSYAWDKEKIVIYKGMANSSLTHETVNSRIQLAWSNQHKIPL